MEMASLSEFIIVFFEFLGFKFQEIYLPLKHLRLVEIRFLLY